MSTDAHLDSLAETPRVPMQLTAGCLLASIQSDITTELLKRFQRDLLDRVKTSRASAVILDVSGVEIMDLDDFDLLRRSMAMATIMGARPILVGLRPGIVASLIALEADVDGIEAAADLDDAFRLVQSAGKRPVQTRNAPESPASTGDR